MAFEIDEVLREATTEELAGLVCGDGLWHTGGIERLGVPRVMMADGPHGLRVEVGGNRKDASAVDVRLIDNKVTSVGGFIWLHTEGDYAMRIGRVEARGNTIDSDSRTEILGGAIETIEFYDNTVSSTSQITHDARPAQHRDNRYTLPQGVNVGFDLDGSETLQRR